jgi:hypothetical protein
MRKMLIIFFISINKINNYTPTYAIQSKCVYNQYGFNDSIDTSKGLHTGV